MLEYLRLTGLLARIARQSIGPDDPRILRRSLESSADACDVWEPRSGTALTIIPVHGVTLAGKDDHRLQSFARSMAASGIRCVVPTLRGLSHMEFVAADADDLAALAKQVSESFSPPVLIGFSLGGTCALLAAAKAGPCVRHIISIGAAHDYERLVDGMNARSRTPPADARERNDRLFLALMMAYRQAAREGRREDLEAIASPLRRFCEGLSKDEAEILEKRLEPLDPIAAECRLADRNALRAASPAGQLQGLRCPTALVHDPHDVLVPPDHAEALHKEIEASGSGHSHHLLITPLLEHVDLKTFRISDLAKLMGILKSLVSSWP